MHVRGLTQAELAIRSGIPQSTIAYACQGRRLHAGRYGALLRALALVPVVPRTNVTAKDLERLTRLVVDESAEVDRPVRRDLPPDEGDDLDAFTDHRFELDGGASG